MDAQSDSCEPPPCNPQPPGKIRKALKLFSKRKPGSGVARIFSVRVKSESGLKSPPSRSKTIDELKEAVAAEAEAESVDLDQADSHKEDAALDEPTRMKNNLESTLTRQSISSLTSAKSLSFLSMLRQNRKGGGEREAQTVSHIAGQQRKGLKGLFGSVRWLRKEKEGEDEVLPGPPLLASRSNSVEIMKENLTLTPRPAHQSTDKSEFEQQPSPSKDINVTPEETNKVSGDAKPSTNDRLSTLLGDISSILSLNSLAGGGDIVADVEAEWVKVSSRVVVEAGTGEAVIKENALLAPKPTFSALSTFSSTSPTLPFSTTKLTSSSPPPKLMPSRMTKQTVLPPSTPSPTTSTKSNPSHTSPYSLTTSVPSPVLSVDFSSISSPSSILVPITIGKSLPSTPSLTIANEPALSTSPLTPEPSPKTSPILFPAPSTATVSKTIISLTETAPEPAADFAKITEPTYTQTPIRSTLNAAPTPIRPLHTQDNKYSIAPVTKYPPFITSTKPVSTAPVIRPKIVTTFGLSTSRNTAPIVKPEPKQSAHQIKSGHFQYQTEKNELGSAVPRASPVDPGPPHFPKHLFAASNQPISATTENLQHKPELAHTALPSGCPLLPTLLIRPVLNIAPCYVPSSEKCQEDVSGLKVAENPQIATFYKPEKKNLVMKATILSKIPVSGEVKSKQHQKHVQSNGERRQWNLPTLVHEEKTLIAFSKESSSKDALSDLSPESGATTPVLSYSNEDIIDSSALPSKGTVSRSRESKIPIKPGSTATYYGLKVKTDVTRSKIPVSKVPIRRTSNKTGSSSTAEDTQK
ncbi:APC membrane recruitment protein 2-like [Silurus asotus]|uniref:APC membrane recruitment protein 2-like n=1 Tax=Silurus asotus TaxID=30991 RepID=A0AAD5APD1_SILAS|nr:APC membrane recruitment protein 2-like [Silurus asotus]